MPSSRAEWQDLASSRVHFRLGPKPWPGWRSAVSLDDSGCRRGLLLIVLFRFSAVVAGWRVAVLPDVLGTAPAPTAPGWPPFRSRGRGGWSVGCRQGAQPLPAGQERLLPGPGAADLQRAGAGVADQPGGQAQ